jgi:hypothetical protein
MLIAFTLFHVVLSLIGIGAGFVFASDLVQSRDRTGWTNIFLVSTIATSVTGFFFPVDHITPAHIFGVISLAVLALAWRARSRVSLSSGWRRSYVISTLFALYLNVFVLVVQMFQKIGPLNALAPTQTEGPFQFAQAAVLLGFCALGFFSLRNYRPAPQTQRLSATATA